MTPFKLNGKPLKIADCWDDVNFGQFLQTFDLTMQDNAKLISIFTGVPQEIVAKARITGLDKVAAALSFLSVPMDFKGKEVNELLGVKMPKDITFEHLAPYEDLMVKILEDLKYDSEGKFKESAECKATYCAIYLQYKKDGEYDSEKAKALLPSIMLAPAMDVLLIGSFFLIRHLYSGTNMKDSSRTIPRTKTKSKPTSKHSTKRSGRTRRSSR